VRPEVKVEPEDRLISFRDVLLGDFAERTFTIENISSFPVSFNLQSLAAGITNKSKQYPFTLIPSQGTIAANSTYEVKIIFQPDQVNDDYFEVLLIDIPNQLHPKEVYLRGQCYSRQVAIREQVPFEWRPLEELKKRYEEPLSLLNHAQKKEGVRPRIVLEFLRDEDAAKVVDYPHLAE